MLIFWRASTPPSNLFAISAANANTQDLELDFIQCGDQWLRTVNQTQTLCAGYKPNCFHVHLSDNDLFRMSANTDVGTMTIYHERSLSVFMPTLIEP
jgi:hypothetical protein